MEFSTAIQKDCIKIFRQRAGLNRRIERELARGIEAYRRWFAEQVRAGNRPCAILAEGDSWFRYPAGLSIMYYLGRLLGIEILNLAKPGDEVRKMLTGKQAARLRKELRRGPARRHEYDFLLFSGGGNDLVGEDTFYKWLHNYESGMTAEDVVNDESLGAALDCVEVGYRELIAIRNNTSEGTQILLHGYDYAFPNGEGVCWFGPWLEPGLKQRRVPLRLRKQVVELFLQRFGERLERLASEFGGVHIIPTVGTLTTESEWHNELHPKNRGFKSMAEKFQSFIREYCEEELE